MPQATVPRLDGPGGNYLSDVESCGGCHPDAFAQQQRSAHAFASFNNPVYRAAVFALREEAGNEASKVCAACHDAALLADGLMDGAIDAYDARAHNGVSCRLCHGIREARRDGNGAYAVAAEALALPVDGDPTSVERHRKAVAPLSPERLCGSCHQSFLSEASGNDVHVGGQSELLSWANSAYAGQGASRIDAVIPQSCVDCHMPKVAAPLGDAAAKEGRISSHDVLGGHTWLAAMRGDEDALRANRELLEGSVSLDVIAKAEGGELVADVVIRNTGVGHRFPGGVRDVGNTVVALRIERPDGRVLLQSESGDGAHTLRAYLADANGILLSRRETHRFAALVADHTIAPRDVAVVRYRGPLPKSMAPGDLVLRAELVHTSRAEELHAFACETSKDARGRAFAMAAVKLGREVLDPCAEQPRTRMADAAVPLREANETTFARAYEHGLGLLHQLQERIGTAEPSFVRALALASTPREKAMAHLGIATVRAKQGRKNDALASLREAEALVPASPAVARTRGDAYAKVWRGRDAAQAYREAAEMAPGNALLWRRYAVAAGSAGLHTEALIAAERGLALEPRAADLLRIAALAQKAHGLDHTTAMESYLTHRGPDNRGQTIQACAEKSAKCALEVLPVHEHLLVPANTPKETR